MPTIPLRSALVTGATGFIGEHLARRLLREGWQVTLLVRTASKLAADLQSDTKIIVGSLADTAALAQAVADVSVVFHCAANVNTWDTPEAYRSTNVDGTHNALQAIATHNPGLARLLHISTADVYGFPEAPCDETSAMVTSGFGYGDSKREGEQLVREFCTQQHIPFTIIRPCNVIGSKSQFIERIGKELASGLMLTINKGRANAGIVYIDSLVDYLIWAARAEIARSECYNVRDPYDVTWAQFIQHFRKTLRGRGMVINMPFSVVDKAAWACELLWRTFLPTREPLLHRLLVCIFGRTCGHSARKIQKHSGIIPQLSFEEAMHRSIEWYCDAHR